MQYDKSRFARLSDALPGGDVTPKIIDFGMALRMNANKTHASNIKQGTPFYMAPEITRQHRLSPASDVYAFGVIMWELMSGASVFAKPCAAPCCRSHALPASPRDRSSSERGAGMPCCPSSPSPIAIRAHFVCHPAMRWLPTRVNGRSP